MNKSILAIALIAVFVIGIVSFDDAFAKKDGLDTVKVGDELAINSQGKGVCTSGEDSGVAKANARFLLKVTEVDEDGAFRGIAKSEIKTNSNCDGIPRNIISDGLPTEFAYVPNGVITIDGDMKDQAENEYTLEGFGQITEEKNGKLSIEMDLEIIDIEYQDMIIELPVQGGIVLMPVTS